MNGQFKQFQYNNASISYSKAGNGKEPLLLFHGFGQDHSVFNSYHEALGQQFTLYSFDLLFHGNSEWHLGEKPLSKQHWGALVTHFLNENGIEKFSLLGFSLGGKLALATLEANPERVNSIFLLAPDGINTNAWYSMATYPIALRYLFKSMITKPGRFMTIVKMAKALHIIDSGVLRFAQSQMESEAMRKRVYLSWVVLRHLKFNQSKIARMINHNHIALCVLVGKYDKIITAKSMSGFLAKIPNSNLQVLHAGHNGLIAESRKVLMKYEAGKDINFP